MIVDPSEVYDETTSAGLPLGIALHRLLGEMRWNGAVDLLSKEDLDCFNSLLALSDDTESSVMASLFLRKGRLFYVPALKGKYAGCTAAAISSIVSKGIATPIDLHKVGNDRIHAFLEVLTNAEIRAIIASVEEISEENTAKKRKQGKSTTKASLLATLASLLPVLPEFSENDAQTALFAFLEVSAAHESLFHSLCDIHCVLAGGKYSHIAHPAAAESLSPAKQQYYRSFRVLEHLALHRPIDIPSASNVRIANELWVSAEGLSIALSAFRLSWEAFARLAAPGKKAVCPEWLRSSNHILEDLQIKAKHFSASANVQLFMAAKCTPEYLTASALSSLAQCAKKASDLPLAVRLFTILTQSGRIAHAKHGEALHTLALCYIHQKDLKNAHRVIRHTLETSYSCICRFESVSDFFRFHSGKANQSHIKLADRIAVERTARAVCKPPFQWNVFQKTSLRMPRTKKITATRCENRKRWRGGNGPCSVEQYTLEYYLDALGDGWTGVHCEGGLLASLFFLLCAELRLPRVESPFVGYVYPSRYRDVPIDFGCPHFVFHRKNSIARLFRRLEAMALDAFDRDIRNTHAKLAGDRYGEMCTSAAVDVLSTVGQALLHRNALIPIMQFVLLEGSLSGLPDVWLWKAGNAENPPVMKCVEVKAPNDSLSDTQCAWMHVLCSAGVDVEVCHVVEKSVVSG